jgi:hypothetical protein
MIQRSSLNTIIQKVFMIQSLVLADCLTKDTAGFVTSPAFGPAKSWTNVHWRGKSAETISTDRVSIDVIG